MNLRILGLVGMSVVLASNPALAIPYKNNNVYKATDGGTQVVVFSGTPDSRVQVNVGSQPKSKARLIGSCGEVRLSVPSNGSFAGLKVDGVPIDASKLPVKFLPSCVSGTFVEPRTANFKTPSGHVVIVKKTPGAAVAIELLEPVFRNVTVNACGFGVLRSSSTFSIPATFSVNTKSYTLASLPNAGNPPLCRTARGVSKGYVPASW